MSQNRAQDLLNQLKSSQRARGRRRPDPLGCYTVLLGFVFALVALAYIYLSFFLNNILRASGQGAGSLFANLMTWLHAPLGLIFGWLMAGLAVCVLLTLWLKGQRIAAVLVTAIVAIYWIAGTFRFVQGKAMPDVLVRTFMAFGLSQTASQRAVPSLIVFALATGVVGLPLLWFLRPLEGSIAKLMGIIWLLLWPILTFGLREYRAGIVLLLSLAATAAVFVVGLRITSGLMLPLADKGQRHKISGFLRDYWVHVNRPASVVVDEPYEEDQVEERVSGDIFTELALGPGLVISDCDRAVAISAGIEFKGVQEPGVNFTRYAEKIRQVVDLRPQLRTFPVEALTKDGIRVKTVIFCACKIDSRGRVAALGEPLPYNKSAGFKAISAQRIEHADVSNKEERKWDDMPRMIAPRILQDIIARYTFDDLYGPYQPGGRPPRAAIAQELGERLTAELQALGIQRVGGGISDLQPADPEVYEKRAQSWQAEWTRRITLAEAEGQAEWLRTVERARADAQADLILRLGHQLEDLSAAKAEFRPKQALDLMVRILDELMTQQPTLRQIVPGETVRALMEISKVTTE